MLNLQTIICSTRPGRVGPSVARWFHSCAQGHGKFSTTLVDLADFQLPVFDEPNHPSQQKYTHDHTKRWSASVAGGDAYVFVTPEYNFGPPPSFVNALNYLFREWNYKPCGFVSYGGTSGGMRAAQIERHLVTALKMIPMTESVPIHRVAQQLDEQKNLVSNEVLDKAAVALLDELLRWAEALKAMRDKIATATT